MTEDHPRSRGVYWPLRWECPGANGSSPLARGLLDAGRAPVGRPGIIPARAGFTPGLRVGGRRVRDHPRSRGVYLHRARGPVVGHGSSPLARGLRTAQAARAPGPGIIPARAGFTALCVRGPRPPGEGSSPLARGLQEIAVNAAVTTRIIPARAGFTVGGRRRPLRAGDHPRSRGVYWVRWVPAREARGSSPLARGLPTSGGTGSTTAGIIPARAGFTRLGLRRLDRRRDHPRSRGVYASSSGTGASSGDHPRSRGVYRHRASRRSRSSGSSPLARGLPPDGAHPSPHLRIIPARAGFTGSGCAATPSPPDHPRSRGVYFARGSAKKWPLGSSPLARGLRARRPHLPVRLRIIPARAGFTLLRHRVDVRVPDHPRSRGVYWWTPPPGSPGSGSSPLARGLPP